MSDLQDHLWFAGTPPIAALGPWILVVEGDVDSIRATLDEAQQVGMGEWFLVDSVEAIPDWGDDQAPFFEAWRLTSEQELVVAENGGDRPDDHLYFEILGGCGE